MDMTLSPRDQAFQEEVRNWLDEAFTPELKRWSDLQAGVYAHADLGRRWHRILYEKGWAAPHWPVEYGGPGWSTVQTYIFETACAEAGAPRLPAMGLQMCGPVLMGYGTNEQKARFLPPMLSGEHYWCQGYSEPQAGSDLASLQTRAVQDGDDYVVNGTKIWTTHAHFANWMFLLARTSSEGRPQAGITFLLTPMDAPGVSVRPILSMSGEHEVNQVFFDDVRIPLANRVGEENQGWTVAKHLLEFERGGGAAAARLLGAMRRLREIAAAERDGNGGSLLQNPDFRRRLAGLEAEVQAVEATERRMISALSSGGGNGNAAASIIKLTSSELAQKVTEAALEAIGAYSLPCQRRALDGGTNAAVIGPEHAAVPTAAYLNTRAATIFGGASQIQRNILARAVLGL